MGLREQTIIKEARITLNDANSQRWTDERLMKLPDDAQQELCREVPLVTRKYNLNTIAGQEEYKLPDDAIKVLTASCNGHTLPTASMEQLDFMNVDWEDEVGNDYLYLVVNNLSQQTVRPFPKLSPDASISNITIKIRYSAKPEHLGWDENTNDSVGSLMVPDMWDYAFTQYVISKAFIDYGDATSLSRAQVAQALYSKEFAEARRKARKSFSKRLVTTGFQGRVASTEQIIGERYGSSYR